MEGINEELEAFHSEMIEQGQTPGSPDFLRELQNKYMTCVHSVRAKSHEKHNVNEAILHAAVLKYQPDQTFQLLLAKISNDHRERLQKVGFQAQ